MMPVDDIENTNCWLSCIQLSGQVRPLDIILALEEENIESRPVWKPMHMQPYFEKYDWFDNGRVSENIFKNGLCLPSDTKMTDDDLEHITETIKKLWR